MRPGSKGLRPKRRRNALRTCRAVCSGSPTGAAVAARGGRVAFAARDLLLTGTVVAEVPLSAATRGVSAIGAMIEFDSIDEHTQLRLRNGKKVWKLIAFGVACEGNRNEIGLPTGGQHSVAC